MSTSQTERAAATIVSSADSQAGVVTHFRKPERSFWEIWNMSFGFLGIQFGWGLQMANMSAIYEYLGARADQIPILWLAAPLTGMIIQPIIGNASDRTWGPLGRRRPYFLTGAILSSLMLLLMPNASALWMAAGMLWILDASINVSMEPFRAFVADLLPEGQRTSGFAMQSLFIGLGASLSSALPLLLTKVFHMQQASGDSRAIPTVVRVAFYLGGVAFLSAVVWTVVTTKEYPPENMEAFLRAKAVHRGIGAQIAEILTAVAEMPATMRRLGPVQLFTWLGLFCMFLYFPIAVAHNVFGADTPGSPNYQAGVEWGGGCLAIYNIVCFFFSFALPCMAKRLGRKNTHSICLLCGAVGLMSVAMIHNKYVLLLTMVGVGIAWASTLSMPYAVLAASLPPARTGVYMGIFNFFIVTPEILASLFFGWIMIHLLNNNRIYAVVAGGVFMLIAAVLMQRVRDPQTLSVQNI
jgi:maltose/moltooligosaccharide transporter